MRIVFDLDDTISVHKNRDFKNACPIMPTILKIRQLKKDGAEIVIYTARGQNSCNGDLELIKERNQDQIMTWLEEHDIPCDELVFGKPLGDLYVDDKGISLNDFLYSTQEALKGNSGEEIFRYGDRVVKRCEGAGAQAKWYRQAERLGVNVPRVHSVVLDTIQMDFIDGEAGENAVLYPGLLYELVALVMRLSILKRGFKFEVGPLVARMEEHLDNYEGEQSFLKLFTYLNDRSGLLREAASFCHGDLSLSNIIFSEKGIFLIDPIAGTEYSSFLMDLAKLRWSLDGGENYLHPELERDFEKELAEYDSILENMTHREIIKALEAVYWIRLLKYTESKQRKEAAIEKAKRLEEAL